MAESTVLRYAVVAVASLLVGAFVALAIAPIPDDDADTDQDMLFEVSTIDALLQGTYDGSVTLDELAEHGDLGTGCGDRLDGELIGVDGEWYLVRTDGRAYPVAGNATTPFAAATFFDPDMRIAISEPMNLTEFGRHLEAELPSKNLFYAIRMEGTFPRVVTRSVPIQEKPYPRLADVTANQAVFTFENVTGTLVGFWTPVLAEGISIPGYHLHFITADRTAGGHLLDITVPESSSVQVDITANFTMVLPAGDFLTVDLSGDLSDDLERVEK
jgi:acetolactate decarboxylase